MATVSFEGVWLAVHSLKLTDIEPSGLWCQQPIDPPWQTPQKSRLDLSTQQATSPKTGWSVSPKKMVTIQSVGNRPLRKPARWGAGLMKLVCLASPPGNASPS